MEHLLFHELDKDGKEIRKVSITQELADELNAKAKKNKDLPTYKVAEKEDDKPKFVIINEKELEKAEVIEAINSQEFEEVKKISANTGVVKVQLAYDGLTDEQKAIVIAELDK